MLSSLAAADDEDVEWIQTVPLSDNHEISVFWLLSDVHASR